MRSSSFFWIAWMMLMSAPFVAAQYGRPALAKGVGLDQRLNTPIPLDALFRDETGQLIPLRTYFGDKPVVLALVYYNCPSLCPMTLQEMVTSMRRVSLEPGRDYQVVVVSIDPKETPQIAAEKKADYAKEFGRASFNSSWHFLTGTQDSISRLASAVGFRYHWDDPTHQFVHPVGIMVATPEGRLSRYIYGIQYAPGDLRMALVEASQHKIGTPVDYVLLFCFHYDAAQGKYTLAIVNVLKIAAGITLAMLAGLIFLLMQRERNQQKPAGGERVHHAG